MGRPDKCGNQAGAVDIVKPPSQLLYLFVAAYFAGVGAAFRV
jgi:hypothetical protein